MEQKTYKTLFFILLAVLIVIILYVIFLKIQPFKPKVSEEIMNKTSEIVKEFDGINIYTLDLEEMVALGESGIYALVEIYRNENSTTQQRWACVMGLSAIGHGHNLTEKVLPYLENALEDEDVNVRVTAAELVMSHGSKNGIPALIAELDNDATLKPSEPVMPINCHCALVLEFYTGQALGVDKAAWQSWWDENKDNLKWEEENEKFTLFL